LRYAVTGYSSAINNAPENNMSSVADRLHAQARIIPVSQPNKVKNITKLENGAMRVEFYSGKVSVLSQDDEIVQAFVVYSVLANGF
jgi:hypothetical protein